MSSKGIVGIVAGLLLVIVVFSSAFTVTAGHQALLLRLGDIVKNKEGKPVVLNPGLHFKLPFVVNVSDFDVRLQSFTVESSRILTAEQKYVLVDYYTKWRIENLALYYNEGGKYRQAQQYASNALKLCQILSPEATAQIRSICQQILK